MNKPVPGENEFFVRSSCLVRVSQAPLRAYRLTDYSPNRDNRDLYHRASQRVGLINFMRLKARSRVFSECA